MNKSILFKIQLFLMTVSVCAHADERILDWHSGITILDDSTMRVIETITVKSENNRINRGIYRDFPTDYKDRFGNRYSVGFTIEDVKRNGHAEPWHTKSLSNGVRVYIGDKNMTIKKGEHVYTLVYTTNRQLGFFDDHDELYWNVTGNDWDFPIDHATATVQLPAGIPSGSIMMEAYTGRSGSTGRNYEASFDDSGLPHFKTTRNLFPKEGMTIVVGWPKGYVHEPILVDEFNYLIRDNKYVYHGIVGILVLLAYYLFAWLKVGRDPDAGIIIPHYEPPSGFSPASMRYIEKMDYDNTCFSAAIINLAVKGCLTIREDDDEYTLELTGRKDIAMAPGESVLVKKLFGGAKKIKLEQSNHSRISKALEAHEGSLERNYEKIYFVTNSLYFGIGLTLSIIILLVSFLSKITDETIGPLIFITLWLTIWSFAIIVLIKNSYNAWRTARKIKNVINAITATLIILPFLFFEIVVIFIYAELFSWIYPVFLITVVLINWLFYELLKSPTLAGREILDRIEGFRQYIELAEKQELDYKYPGGRTPELFETYLPYALALGLEQKWCEQFTDVFEQKIQNDHAYSPSWYRGSHWNPADARGFSSSLGSSFTSAVASSSTAPGSSSGMSGGGGGGSSGGGGGGGGGGGW